MSGELENNDHENDSDARANTHEDASQRKSSSDASQRFDLRKKSTEFSDATVLPYEDEVYEAVVIDEVAQGAAPATQPVNVGSPFRDGPVPHQPAFSPANEWGSPGALSSTIVPVWMPQYENYAARAGAFSAVFLGVMTILGGLVTPMAILNGLLGVSLGMWGLTSERRKLSIIGITMCAVGIAITFIRLSISAAV